MPYFSNFFAFLVVLSGSSPSSLVLNNYLLILNVQEWNSHPFGHLKEDISLILFVQKGI